MSSVVMVFQKQSHQLSPNTAAVLIFGHYSIVYTLQFNLKLSHLIYMGHTTNLANLAYFLIAVQYSINKTKHVWNENYYGTILQH